MNDSIKRYDLHKDDYSKLHFEVNDGKAYFEKNKIHAAVPHRHSFYQIIWKFIVIIFKTRRYWPLTGHFLRLEAKELFPLISIYLAVPFLRVIRCNWCILNVRRSHFFLPLLHCVLLLTIRWLSGYQFWKLLSQVAYLISKICKGTSLHRSFCTFSLCWWYRISWWSSFDDCCFVLSGF